MASAIAGCLNGDLFHLSIFRCVLSDDRIRFDFDDRVAVDQRATSTIVVAGRMSLKTLAVDAGDFFPFAHVGHEHPRADDVLQLAAERFDRRPDDGQRAGRLLADCLGYVPSALMPTQPVTAITLPLRTARL